MADLNYLYGIIEKSETKKRGFVGLITILTIDCNGKSDLEVSISGRHNIRAGDRIKISYEVHSQVYWGISYEIQDKHGKVLHSDVSDY